MELPFVQHVCWYDVLRSCLGEVVTFLWRHHTESVQFQQVVNFLESGCVEFFLVRIQPLLSFGLGATQKDCVSLSNTAIPSILMG